MASEGRSARDLAMRLIAHAATDDRALASGAVGAAATAFERMSAELSRWLGSAGCHALLSRALRHASANHLALSRVGIGTGSQPFLTGLTESDDDDGATAVAAGLESALVVLFELLDRLIGEDLSTKLAELSMADTVTDAAEPESEDPVQS